MKNLLFSILFLTLSCGGVAQTPQDLAVELSANLSENENSITLQWPNTNASVIKVYRKSSTANSSFLAPIANLSGSAIQYVDSDIEIGEAYEYRIEKQYSNYSANGYLLAGIKVPLNENKGKLILLVSAEMAIPLQQELEILESDIEGDGWNVVRIDVQNTEGPVAVRNRIINTYNTDPSNVKALFIVGHVAVPYSGLIVPDGHIEHRGAWPADVYYGDMNGNWTDTEVNDTNAEDPRNHNVPGDGKFDQSELPSDLELQVGRVDFYDLAIFEKSETELLRKYLNKNHEFRHRFFVATERALVDDNFGGGENSFSSSAYRSFYSMFSAENVHAKDYFTTMANESYLWSHGNGPGYYNSVRDVGESIDFVNTEVNTVFTTLFGSYLGDWDTKNNIMRASLASGSILTCAWSGLPQWQFHQMALGENIGLSAKNTSNAFEYEFTYYNSKMVHVALLGDPTLRMHTVTPPEILQVVKNEAVELSWGASNESVLGYHVYSRKSATEVFERLNSELITETSFLSNDTSEGRHYYMVRAVKLEETPSGSYYNLSQGVFAEIQLDEEGVETPIEEELPEEEEPEEEDTPPVGEQEEVEEPQEEIDTNAIIIYPNPATEVVYIETVDNVEDIVVSDVSGKMFLRPSNTIIDVSTLPNGFYILQFITNNKLEERFLIKQE